MQTVSDRVALKRSKLSKDGQRVISILMTEYGMTQEAALRLAKDSGPMFAVALLSRRGVR